ncbi:hypothetical protein SAY86_026833 [Trapa natans]|uniref:SPT2 chromatin protein n=1 Tax=Trapa natans TaxID=22666 RepID=A0AAN7KJ69_TRANT|nr:hypothetical protein SAY86_026833 [Trapa natans]
MGGYENDEYEDYDDYEEEEYEQEEDEYEEEKEDPKPTKEELEYLELRQKLKESIRKRMKKEASGSQKIMKDSYGSFFGPAKPMIAPRVIEESKPFLENQQLASCILKIHQTGKNNSSTRPGGSKPCASPQAPRISELKRKVQKIKDNRDYSFLLSEDAELPASPKFSSDGRSAKISSQSSGRSPTIDVWRANGGWEERRPISTNGHTNPRPGSTNVHLKPSLGSLSGQLNSRPVSTSGHLSSRLSSATGQHNSRPGSANGHHNPKPLSINAHHIPRPGFTNGHTNSRPGSYGHTIPRTGSSNGHVNHRPDPKLSPDSKPQSAANKKQLLSNTGNGPSWPALSNGLPPKKPILPPSRSSSQSSTAVGLKPPTAKMQSISKCQAALRRDILEAGRGKIPTKHALPPSRPQVQAQMHKPQKQVSSHNRSLDQRSKKRPSRPFPDDDDSGDAAISMIRKMFRYNPQKFAGRDEDDSDMEANFEDIMREEKRSARIAREEDEEQLRLIEEEERREHMRKMGKKRKVG